VPVVFNYGRVSVCCGNQTSLIQLLTVGPRYGKDSVAASTDPFAENVRPCSGDARELFSLLLYKENVQGRG